MLQPLTFEPYLKTVIWGGSKIKGYKHIDTDLENVGESWELSAVPGHESVVADGGHLRGRKLTELIELYGADMVGTRVMERSGKDFPLLIKVIDAQRDLSVQVHPDDTLAKARHNSLGKTEMWYVIDSEPGARIYTGLSASLTPEEYERRIADDTIMDVVAAHESHPGQFYFVPAGTIHAIGAGNLIAEIQQSSDITYRVYDYNRLDANGQPRELHTALAKDAIDYRYPRQITPTAESCESTTVGMVRSEYFSTDYVVLCEGETYTVDTKGETFAIVMVIKGTLTVHTGDQAYTYGQGTTVLLPASLAESRLSGEATLLVTTC